MRDELQCCAQAVQRSASRSGGFRPAGSVGNFTSPNGTRAKVSGAHVVKSFTSSTSGVAAAAAGGAAGKPAGFRVGVRGSIIYDDNRVYMTVSNPFSF